MTMNYCNVLSDNPPNAFFSKKCRLGNLRPAALHPRMKRLPRLALLLSFVVSLTLAFATGAAAPTVNRKPGTVNHDGKAIATPDPLATLRAEHPRLIFTPQDWAAFDQRVKNRAQDPQFNALMSQLEKNARKLLTTPPLTHKKIGRRLLAVSREAFRRVTTLAIVYRATHDEAFARRAEKEMLTVAAFTDWNPSHFLDVGEMTAALALGYDWFHEKLPPESRDAIRRAIIEKGITQGIDPKLPHNGWQKNENNWNQVCWGGLTLGALAIAEDEPQLALDTLKRARAGIVHGLKPYAPDGVYPEGPGYWSYGTSYQVLMIAALESALGTDWDLSRSPGFMQSAAAQFQLTGPTGYMFNFSDCGRVRLYDPVLFWFAKKLNTPSLAVPPDASAGTNRFQPLVALWWPEKGLPATNAAPPDLPLAWKGEGVNPVAVFRSSWTDPNAMWLAIKAGAANANHGHMDAGSFIFEADGVRWAIDLGMQDYESLESRGMNIFGRTQNAQRWTIFRMNNFSHNTLTIGGQLHRVDGRAEFKNFWHGGVVLDADWTANGAEVDLSPVFAGQATKVQREFNYRPETRTVTIYDHIEGTAPGAEIRWAMVTKAQIQIKDGGHEALLRLNGKQLLVRTGDSYCDGARIKCDFEVISADSLKNDYDAPNPDTRILIVRAKASTAGRAAIVVALSAGGGSGLRFCP